MSESRALAGQKKGLTSAAVESRDEIRNALAAGYGQRCRICAAPEFDVYKHRVFGQHELYYSPPDIGLNVYRFATEQAGEMRQIAAKRTITQMGGAERLPPFDNLRTRISTDWLLLHDAAKQLNCSIEMHHVSYEPEITIPLCSECHNQVHHGDGLDALQPSMKRREWDR